MSQVKKLKMNPEPSGNGLEVFKQGSYMNMQAFLLGGYGSGMKRETINRR